MANILQVRLALIYTETTASLLQDQAPAAPMRFMGDEHAFADEFERVERAPREFNARWWQENIPEPLLQDTPRADYKDYKARQRKALNKFLAEREDLTPPWFWMEHGYPHHFWKLYLGNRSLDQVDGDTAWKYIVPLRQQANFKARAAWLPGWITLDAFYYPHGIAAVVGVTLACPTPAGWAPAEVLKLALRVRWRELYEIVRGGAVLAQVKLDEVGRFLLDESRGNLLGVNMPAGTSPTAPLAVATIVRGADVNPDEAVKPNGDIHRLLNALCTWPPSPQANRLVPLEDLALGLRSSRAEGSILCGLKRSRAVWFPDALVEEAGRDLHRLGCYHQNLTLVMLQTAMLCEAARLYDARPDPLAPPPVALYSLAHAAVTRLGLLYGAHADTYRSASPRAYVDDNHLKDMLERVRVIHGMEPLSYQAYE